MSLDKYWQVLGLSPNSSQEDLKKKYRELAKQHHPDTGGNEEEFKKINEAYSILSGKQQPKVENPFQQGAPGGFGGFGLDFDLSDILNQFRGASRGQSPFSRGFTHIERPPSKDEEIGFQLNISLSDIKQGKSFKIPFQQSEDCMACVGLGGKNRKKCPRCDGQGQVVYENKQGMFAMRSVQQCSHCNGRCYQYDEICSDCSGRGFKIFEKDIEFSVKVK